MLAFPLFDFGLIFKDHLLVLGEFLPSGSNNAREFLEGILSMGLAMNALGLCLVLETDLLNFLHRGRNAIQVSSFNNLLAQKGRVEIERRERSSKLGCSVLGGLDGTGSAGLGEGHGR